jgi:hypothetical protein
VKKFPRVSSKVSSPDEKFPIFGVRFPTRKPGNFLQIVALGAGLQGFLVWKLHTYQETQSFLTVSSSGFLACEVS